MQEQKIKYKSKIKRDWHRQRHSPAQRNKVKDCKWTLGTLSSDSVFRIKWNGSCATLWRHGMRRNELWAPPQNRANPSHDMPMPNRVYTIYSCEIFVGVCLDKVELGHRSRSDRREQGEGDMKLLCEITLATWIAYCTPSNRRTLSLNVLFFAYFPANGTFSFRFLFFFSFRFSDKRPTFPYRFKVTFSFVRYIRRLVHSFYCFL